MTKQIGNFDQEPKKLSPARERANAIVGFVLLGLIGFGVLTNAVKGGDEAQSCTPDRAGAIAIAQSAVGETIDNVAEIESARAILQSEIDRCR